MRHSDLDDAKEMHSHFAGAKSEVALSSYATGAHKVFDNLCFLKTHEQFVYMVNIIKSMDLRGLL